MAAVEQKKNYAVVKDFKGVNTKNNRTVIDNGEFSWIENAMPIGYGNIKILNAASQLANVSFANTVTYMTSVNINNTEYVLAFQDDGRAQYVNVGTGSVGNIANAGTFSNTGVMATQWKNERALIIDPNNGYKTWDGTNLHDIGSVNSITINNGGSGYTANTTVSFGAPNQANGIQATGEVIVTSNAVAEIVVTEAGTGYTSAPTVTITGAGSSANVTCTILDQNGIDVATFSGRSWIADGRTVFYSATDTFNDFYNVSAGFLTITDSTLRTDIIRILSANNFLYLFGEDSINVFSDVRVDPATGVSLFTNTNVSASIGTKLNHAIFPYFRSILFMNEYGVYALVGSTTTKISDPLDGIFPLIDFNAEVTGGQCLINNILCAVWNFKYDNNGTDEWIQAVFFERKWFFSNQLTNGFYITNAFDDNILNAYATTGTNLHRFYNDSTTGVDVLIETALMPMGDPIRDKQALKIGIEATLGNLPIVMVGYVDSESAQSPPIVFANSTQWINNSLAPINWINNSSNVVIWTNSINPGAGYYLYRSDAKMYGKYLGMTITATATPFTISGLQYEHELRARF